MRTGHPSKSSKKKGSAPLKLGRPPLLSSPSTSIPSTGHTGPPTKKSSKATRTLIRAHHNLHKSRAKALLDGNQSLVAELDAQIAELGGLDAYQTASLTGQGRDRGGDSSLLLVKWLEEYDLVNRQVRSNADLGTGQGLRVLEIGALSSRNAISALRGKGVESVKRIDLKSQEPNEIEEIDFMQLAIPSIKEHKYDVVSLSLVLNYVPDPAGRGNMLRRTTMFLRHQSSSGGRDGLPCIFIVLPLPCVTNSRYLTTDHFRNIMASLGYTSLKTHQSKKLHYELFRWAENDIVVGPSAFKKVEINPGKARNNFCITLDVT